jgi:hypothetical protein
MVSDSLESGEAASGAKHGLLETSRSKRIESKIETGTGAIGVSGTGSPASSTGRRTAPKLQRKTPHKDEK